MPLLGPAMDTRNQAFQKLKPACVAVSQATLALDGPRRDVPILTKRLQDLQRIIVSFPASNNPLDEKLADYIFFPLSHVLKFSQRVSLRCLEITLEILGVLIEYGWRSNVQAQLASQVWILCTLLAGEKPTGLVSSGTTVELRAAALTCLSCLFNAFGGSVEGRSLLQGESNVPQVGQTISTALDALGESVDLKLQLAAVSCLDALVRSINDREMLAGFLPGIVSRLTKILKPQTKQRRDHLVLANCLDLLRELLMSVVSDGVMASFAAQSQVSPVAKKEKKGGSNAIDATWYETAAVQIKPAMIGIFRLRDHERDDVKSALAQLALMLLRSCRKSLANCSAIALETLLVIAMHHAPTSASELEFLVSSNPSLTALLQELLHDWLQSLIRIMQSADDQAKTQRLQQIRAAYELLRRTGADMTLLDRIVAKSLSESVVIAVQVPKTQQPAISFVQPLQSLDLTLSKSCRRNTEFGSALVTHRGQEEVLDTIESFIETIGKSPEPSMFTTDIARSLRQSTGDAQLATFWILYTATKSALDTRADPIDDMLNFSMTHTTTTPDSLLEELYSHSLTLLTTNPSPDPRHQRLALRTLALRAQHLRLDFRPDLYETLYPVLHTLATPHPALQTDATTTLNILTSACGYTSTREMIVENVDYLTNAVALKLNASDLSPQAPQVLLMMVRLAGARLLPYLEDTVESIFVALEGFHGYAGLVELLFGVLRGVAEEGVRAEGLSRIEGGDGKGREERVGVERWKPIGVAGLGELLRERREGEHRAAEELKQEREKRKKAGTGDFPHAPWKEDAENTTSPSDDDDPANPPQPEEPPDLPPSPKTYTLLLKISELTQHFLPSASAPLRSLLLSLLTTTLPTLASHENSFLPLINTLWPEITARLEADEEAHVRASALRVVGVLCEEAGDFMRGRIREMWPLTREVYSQVVNEIAPRVSKPGSRALVARHGDVEIERALLRASEQGLTASVLLWEALIGTLLRIARFVPVEAGVLEEVLEMCGPVLGREEVREVLEEATGDAYWLAGVRKEMVAEVERPEQRLGGDGREWAWAEVK